MNPSVKEMWLTALRSGEYKQTIGRLARKDETGEAYCCLGVLCDLAVKEGIVQRDVKSLFDLGDDSVWDNDFIYFDEEEAVLPQAVQEWAGLTAQGNEPAVDWRDERNLCLTAKNDGGASFEDIAIIIEGAL